jgi:hypothetical protein
MSAEVRFFHSKPHNLLVMRFMGNLPSRFIFQQLRDFVENDPPMINAMELWDTRMWGGMIFDDELAEQIAWNYTFRLKHALATDNLAPIAVLTHTIAGRADVGPQFVNIRNQPIPVSNDPSIAWAHLVPDVPLPHDVRKFLARR